jgi:hypothetical protein
MSKPMNNPFREGGNVVNAEEEWSNVEKTLLDFICDGNVGHRKKSKRKYKIVTLFVMLNASFDIALCNVTSTEE